MSESVNSLRELILRGLKRLPENQRRDAFRLLVSVVTHGGNEALASQAFYKKLQDRESADQLASVLSTHPAGLREVLWTLCEVVFSDSRTKELGQYFTPAHVINFALAGLNHVPETVLDPMAGHGAFIRRVRQRFPASEVTGVELDTLLAECCELVVEEDVRIVNRDVFAWAVSLVEADPSRAFSAVVGNPAYVSYQGLRSVGQVSGDYESEKGDYRGFLTRCLKEITQQKEMLAELATLFKEWSGYSDLSVYSLILSWLLAKEEGEIAFVMTNHWMERDYGIPIKKFLANHGTVRVIASHRRGNWFPGAQVPTSVMVYSKGDVSGRQRKKGIPYVEVLGPSTPNISDLLERELGQDFWAWLDVLDEPGTYGSLHVSFLRWFEDEVATGRGTSHRNHNGYLRLPSHLERQRLATFADVGWSVHQGLRTGCDAVFYVRNSPDPSDDHGITLTVPTDQGDSQMTVRIPPQLLLPAVKKLPRASPLLLNESHCDAYVLDLRKAVLPDDARRLYGYPTRWRAEWRLEEIEVMPASLAGYLEAWADTRYPKGKGRPKVKDLTAVRANIAVPSPESPGMPNPPRFWYQLRLRPRHFGEVIIPRVSSGPVRTFVLENAGRIVIDANFVTLVSGSPSVSKRRLSMWLNSNTFRAMCELNGVRLGGGALKLEATFIRKMPIPLDALERCWDDSVSWEDWARVDGGDYAAILSRGSVIDRLLFGPRVAQDMLHLLSELVEQRHHPTAVGSKRWTSAP